MKNTPPSSAGTVLKKTSFLPAVKKLWGLMASDRRNIGFALVAVIITSILNLIAPLLFGYAIDTFIQARQYQGAVMISGLLFLAFIVAFGFNYAQMRLMGGVGQSVLFKLRNTVFSKLQELPISFFNENKSGDLISRINNDTDKLNQFFSETLVRFVGSIFIIGGAGIFIIILNARLGLTALLPALFIFLFTRFTSDWVKQRTSASLKSIGALSGEVQESLDNFKVIVAFNRRDYFRDRFQEVNRANFTAAVKAGMASGIFMPIYDFASNVAQLIVFSYGLLLISRGELSVGILLSFLIYIDRFYAPLKQIAMLWSSLQLALAAWDRVSDVLDKPLTMTVVPDTRTVSASPAVLEFKDVSFGYVADKLILQKISVQLETGKTYALVGPTGGGKTTTASLMARLYDPTTGTVLLQGKDLRSYTDAERAQRVGFILQEPFLFSGTILDNIFYGNDLYRDTTPDQRRAVLKEAKLDTLLARFDNDLEAKVLPGGDAMSLGQRQLIAFMRAVLRKPDVLILDEATANIDTVTEQSLEEVLQALPKTTTKVIIAHRLNTIENADEIFFVNAGEITPAGSLEQAINLLMKGKRAS